MVCGGKTSKEKHELMHHEKKKSKETKFQPNKEQLKPTSNQKLAKEKKEEGKNQIILSL